MAAPIQQNKKIGKKKAKIPSKQNWHILRVVIFATPSTPHSKKEKQQPPSLPHPAASPILLLIKPNQKSIVEEE